MTEEESEEEDKKGPGVEEARGGGQERAQRRGFEGKKTVRRLWPKFEETKEPQLTMAGPAECHRSRDLQGIWSTMEHRGF